MKAHVLIGGDTEVQAGDMLVHVSDGTAGPQRGSLAGEEAFAQVIDPTPIDKAPSGSYRVQCELLMKRRFIPKGETTHG